MFKNLTTFSYKRSLKEAVGFYISYLVLTIVVSMALSVVLGVATGNENNFNFGVRVGTFTSMVLSGLLSFLILSKKKLMNKFPNILLAFLGLVLAYFGGGLLGLIIPAYFSRK